MLRRHHQRQPAPPAEAAETPADMKAEAAAAAARARALRSEIDELAPRVSTAIAAFDFEALATLRQLRLRLFSRMKAELVREQECLAEHYRAHTPGAWAEVLKRKEEYEELERKLREAGDAWRMAVARHDSVCSRALSAERTISEVDAMRLPPVEAPALDDAA